MTDRMTERFDTPETPGSSNADAPLYGATDLEGSGRSETVTSSAAVDELSLGQGTGSGSSGDAGAKDHAQAVAQDAKESTKGVASTAASEAKDVAREAKTQLRQLLDQLGGEATQQASGQTQRAVQGLRSLGSELSGMADGQQGGSGMASGLARQGASQLDAAANWLDGRQPGELLDEVRSFARRRPGTFIAGAALLGLIGGRMTRGLTADSSSDGGQSATAQGYSGAATYGTSSAQGVPTAYGAGAAYGEGTAYETGTTGTAYDSGTAYDTGTAYGAEPVDLIDTDPAAYPGPSTGVTGESR